MVRDSLDSRRNHHLILIAILIVVVLVAWVEECFSQGGFEERPILLETPYAPSGYAQLLRDYVVEIPALGGGIESRFQYAQFSASANQVALRGDLRRRFLSVNPEAMDPATRHAWAVNAYNFLVIDLVVEHFVAPGKDTLTSIRELGPKPLAVFEETRYTVANEAYSLNSFEKHFVFDDKDGKTAPVDPRYHFVLVCAAKGCPPLLSWPIAPEDLDDTLDRAVRNALRTPGQLRLDGKTLHVSKIFDWYAADFQERNPRAFLSRYAPDDVRLALSQKDKVKEIRPDIEWDWDLNRP
jgi:uncharacterized protein DUF547